VDIGSNVVAAVTVSTAPANIQFATRNLAGSLAVRMTLTSEGELQLASAKMPPPAGVAPLYAARAYGQIDSSGTLNFGKNVGNVNRNATGDYTITFELNQAESNYSIVVWGTNSPTTSFTTSRLEATPTGSGFRVQFMGWNGTTFVDTDPYYWNFAVFG